MRSLTEQARYSQKTSNAEYQAAKRIYDVNIDPVYAPKTHSWNGLATGTSALLSPATNIHMQQISRAKATKKQIPDKAD